MEESKYDRYASMRDVSHLYNINDNESDESDADIPESLHIGRGRKTANDMKQWIFVVKKVSTDNIPGSGVNDETQPLLTLNNNNNNNNKHQSAGDALDLLHEAQTRSTLEMDIKRTDLHISTATLPSTVPSPVPDVDFLYVGISEKRMKHWCDKLEYQLNLEPTLTVEWLLMIDNQLAHATNNDSIENRQFNLQCWRDLYVRYYSQHVSEHIFKFYRKYGYGYDESYAKDQFHVATDVNMYSRDISQGSIFREVDRIRLTKFSFQSNLSSTMNNGYLSTFPIDQIDKRIKDKNNVLIDAFPCHEYDVLADIYQQIWSTIRCTSITTVFQIPLAAIRDYYGEKLAYYFLFLVTYTRYMIPLASVGFFFQIYQFTNAGVEVELIGFFAILVLIWGAIIPLLWRQEESRYACKWGQYSNETSDPEHLENTRMDDFSNMAKVKKGKIHYLFEPEMERVEFRGKPKRSTIDGAVIKTDDELQKIKNYSSSYGLLLTVLIAITGLSVTIVIFEFFVQYYVSDKFVYGTYGFGILNAFSMLIMEYISLWFIPMINNFENHRTNVQHAKAYFGKKIAFDFVNYYISLLFIVFVVPLTSLELTFVVCAEENCLTEIQTHFGSVFVTLIVCRLLVYLYNFTCGKYSYRKMGRVPSTAYFKPFYDIHESFYSINHNNYIIPPSRKPELTANEYLLYDYLCIQKPMNEFLIQFGYLVTFGLFFPWCAPLSLGYNLLVIRLELHKLIVFSRRPFPQGANGIAPYNTAFKIMTFLSIFVVFYTFTIDSYELRLWKNHIAMFPKLLDWVALIVIFSIFYAILLWLFPAVPKQAKDHIKRQMFVDQSISTNYKDMKSFQESMSISSLLRLRQWTSNEVHDYFNTYGNPRYTQFAKIALKKHINGEKLLYLTKRDLQLFGIDDQFHRLWIEGEIEALKSLHRHVTLMVKQQRNNQNIDNIHMDQLQSWMKNQESNHHRDYLQNDDDIDQEIDNDQEQEYKHDDDDDDDDDDKEETAPQLQHITSTAWDDQPIEKSSSPPLDLENILEEVPSKIDDKSNASDYDSTDSRTEQVLTTNNDEIEAYKSLSKIALSENTSSPVIIQDEFKEGENGVIVTIDNEQDEEMNEKDENVKKFGNVEIGKLTVGISGKSVGDILILKDIISQYQTVIKEHARVKLIKSYASKKIQVNEFKSNEEIHGLLELIISCVIKLKYKDNVEFDKSKRKLELSEFIEWIVNDKNTMNGESWNVDKFAQVFDDWICQIIDN